MRKPSTKVLSRFLMKKRFFTQKIFLHNFSFAPPKPEIKMLKKILYNSCSRTQKGCKLGKRDGKSFASERAEI